MKITVFVGTHGRVVGTARKGPSSGGMQAAMIPAPGHTVHELEVPDDHEKLSAAELHEKLNAILIRSRTPPGRRD
jgi:hypothetical protein